MEEFKIKFGATLSDNAGAMIQKEANKLMKDFKIKVDVQIDDSNLRKSQEKIISNISKLGKIDTKIDLFSKMADGDKELAAKIDNIKSKLSSLNSIKVDSNKGLFEYTKNLTEISGQVDKLSNEFKNLNTISKAALSSNDLTKTQNKIIQNIGKLNSISAQVNLFGGMVNGDEELLAKINNIKTQLASLKSIDINSNDGLFTYTKNLAEIDGQVKLLSNSLKENGKISKNVFDSLDVSKQAKSLKDAETYIKNNSKAARDFGAQLEMAKNNIAAATNPADLKAANSEFNLLKSTIKSVGLEGRTMGQELKNAMSKFSNWIGASTIIMQGIRGVKSLVNNVVSVDTAMTSLYKVTDETAAKYNEFLTSANYNAIGLGKTVSSLVEQTAQWAKLGYNIDDSASLAKTSSIYANVGEVEDETAVKDIVTALKAFNIEAGNSITVVDKLNKLGNEFATDSGSLGEGLTKAASALNLAGNDIDQSLAMITGATEITQNASESANGIKILSMRLRGMKGALQDIGEEYEDIESVSKIQTQIYNLTDGVVNIFDDAGNFKSTYEIIKGISTVWSDISQIKQADLLEVIAGKQRGNQIAALIQSAQSGQMQKAFEAAANADGSAQKEQDRWLGSVEAKVEQLKASWEGLSNSLLNSNVIKFFVDFGTTATSALTRINNSIGSIGTVGAVLGGVLGAKGLGWAN